MQHAGSIALKREPTQTKPQRKLPSDEWAWLMGMLVGLAEARQASLSEEGYSMYCQSLSGFDRVDLRAAIEHFAMEPRAEYRSAFPSLGDIAEGCRQEASKRRTPKQRYCGHCRDGRIRLRNGDIVVCDCVCPKCDSTGWLFVKANGEPWNPGDKDERFARYCDCRRSA